MVRVEGVLHTVEGVFEGWYGVTYLGDKGYASAANTLVEGGRVSVELEEGLYWLVLRSKRQQVMQHRLLVRGGMSFSEMLRSGSATTRHQPEHRPFVWGSDGVVSPGAGGVSGLSREQVVRLVADELKKVPPGGVSEERVREIAEAEAAEAATMAVGVVRERLDLYEGRLTALESAPKPPAGVSGSAKHDFYPPGARRLAIPTYWWADEHYNTQSNWAFVRQNLDLVPFVLINPASGPGLKAEKDFQTHAASMNQAGVPVFAYVRTVTDLANRVLRPAQDVMNDLEKYVLFYGEKAIQGVFLDEVYNGWDEKYAAQQQHYLDLVAAVRNRFPEWQVAINPGSPTTDYIVDAVDVILCFEHNPTRFNESLQGLKSDWYRRLPARKLWVVVHDVVSEVQARSILDELGKMNIANVYLTTDSFNGVVGGENEANNPWDNLPAEWLQRLQTDWMRHNLLPAGLYSYETGKPVS